MTRAFFFAIASWVALVCTFAPRSAVAQPADLVTIIDSDEVELGDTVTYSFRAEAPGEMPGDAQLGPHNGFTVVSSHASPTHMVTMINGQVSQKNSLTATWVLRADRLGTFVIGPATISLASGRKSSQPKRVSVVPPGAGKPKRRPARPDPFGGSPFDPFKGLFPDLQDEPPPMAEPPTDPQYGLDNPRGTTAFLHATIDKTNVVVGEQVTLTVYLYEDPRARQSQPADVHEATAPDFVKRSLVQDETRATALGNALVGGRVWSVKLVRKNALFPLKAGHLTISPMSITLPQVRPGVRESEPLSVEVTEPALAGRPPGYQIGDVGDLSLSASMAPRTIDQHGAVGVTVELRGTGNLPAQLPVPVMPGIEWLEPQTRDALGPMQRDRFGGTRTFSYVVRVHKAGAVDLGEIRLPYYDPTSRSYNVARAALGIVEVKPGAARDAGVDQPDPILPGLPQARPALEGRPPPRAFITEQPGYWAGLFGAPFACVLGLSAARVARRVRERRANAAPSPGRIARERRAEAEAKLGEKDGKAAIAAIVRAIEAEILASTGVNVRGAASDEVQRELVDRGVDAHAAKQTLDALAACENARFSPEGVEVQTARTIWEQAKIALGGIEARERVSAAPEAEDE